MATTTTPINTAPIRKTRKPRNPFADPKLIKDFRDFSPEKLEQLSAMLRDVPP